MADTTDLMHALSPRQHSAWCRWYSIQKGATCLVRSKLIKHWAAHSKKWWAGVMNGLVGIAKTS